MGVKGGCGDPECCASSGYGEEPTFGKGPIEINEMFTGYWEHPCSPCARAFEKAFPQYAPCWPFEDEEKDDDRTGA